MWPFPDKAAAAALATDDAVDEHERHSSFEMTDETPLDDEPLDALSISMPAGGLALLRQRQEVAAVDASLVAEVVRVTGASEAVARHALGGAWASGEVTPARTIDTASVQILLTPVDVHVDLTLEYSNDGCS